MRMGTIARNRLVEDEVKYKAVRMPYKYSLSTSWAVNMSPIRDYIITSLKGQTVCACILTDP